MTPIELFEKVVKWLKTSTTEKRLTNGENGYQWMVKDLEYDGEYDLESVQQFFERDKQNADFKKEYDKPEVADKKAFGFHQTDANLIAAFHRSFALRNKSRLQCYRDDMSMKGKRVIGSLYNTLGKHEAKKEATEK